MDVSAVSAKGFVRYFTLEKYAKQNLLNMSYEIKKSSEVISVSNDFDYYDIEQRNRLWKKFEARFYWETHYDVLSQLYDFDPATLLEHYVLYGKPNGLLGRPKDWSQIPYPYETA